jgi:hypothetical protein
MASEMTVTEPTTMLRSYSAPSGVAKLRARSWGQLPRRKTRRALAGETAGPSLERSRISRAAACAVAYAHRRRLGGARSSQNKGVPTALPDEPPRSSSATLQRRSRVSNRRNGWLSTSCPPGRSPGIPTPVGRSALRFGGGGQETAWPRCVIGCTRRPGCRARLRPFAALGNAARCTRKRRSVAILTTSLTTNHANA